VTRIKFSISKQLFVIERHGRLDNIIDAYCGGLGFISRPGQQLFGLRFATVLVRRGPEGRISVS